MNKRNQVEVSFQGLEIRKMEEDLSPYGQHLEQQRLCKQVDKGEEKCRQE